MKPNKLTIPVSKLSNLAMMTGGEKKVTVVIHNGQVKEWVGIGWLDLGPPTKEERKRIPQAVYEDGSPA